MKRIIIAATAAILTSLTLTPAASASSRESAPPAFSTRACEYEDSLNCTWDAGSSGNGRGHSFWAVRVSPSTGCIRYMDRDYAKRNDFCTSVKSFSVGEGDRELYPHANGWIVRHQTVTPKYHGVPLTKRQKANVVKIVHRLPVCKAGQPSNCKVREGKRTLASFRADRLTYFVVMTGGRLIHAETYPTH